MKHTQYEPSILTVSYEELEEIVQAYKNGNKEMSEQIIGAFWKYIQKFIRIIDSGKVDISDKQVRHFIRLFMTKEEGSVTHQFRKSERARRNLLKSIDNIRYIFKNVKQDELVNEAVLALLTIVDRYNSKGNFFHTYVSRVFHFQYYRQLRELLLLEPSHSRLPYSDEEYVDDIGEYADGIIEDTRFLINEPLEEINENWINGLTAGDYFEDLTPTQRRILKLHYEDGLKDEDIAEVMSVCRATINRRRLAAIKVVEGQLKNLNTMEDENNEDEHREDTSDSLL